MADEQWISVKDKLPEIMKEFGGKDDKLYGSSDAVLCLSENKIAVGEYYKSGGWGCLPEGSKLIKVTHWMPLPDLPTVKSETGGDHGR